MVGPMCGPGSGLGGQFVPTRSALFSSCLKTQISDTFFFIAKVMFDVCTVAAGGAFRPICLGPYMIC